MKIAVLAPYSRPWDIGDVEGSGINLVVRESCEALAKKGYKIKVFTRCSRVDDKKFWFPQKNIEVITIKAGPKKKLGREEVYKECKNITFPIEMIQDCDFVIAHYWISEAWISQISNKCHLRVLYFSHSYFLNPDRDFSFITALHRNAEIKLMQKVVWCANSKKEFQTLRSVYSNINQVALVPLAIKYDKVFEKDIKKK